MLFLSIPQQVKAIPVVCVNCNSLPQGLFSNIKEAWIAIETKLGTYNQMLDTINNKILKPMKDAMTIAQIAKSGQLTKSLVTAATGGDPLLVSNPQLYLKNKSIAVTQGGVDSLASQNGVYSNSLMNSIVAKAKGDNSSLATTLAGINQSSIPAIQKAKICNDASLTQMAKSQVALSGGDYNAVKASLNNSLCAGNPATDPALAKRLIDVSNKNPSLDSFYAITSGDNAYTKAQKAQQATDKAAEAAKLSAAKDTAAGGGVKSKTTCTKFASNGLCIEETIAQASSVINKAYNDALSSDLKVAISSIGSGAGSILGAFANTMSLFNGFTSAVNSLAGSSGSNGAGSGNNGKLGTVSMPGTVTSSSSTTGSVYSNTTVNTTFASSTGYSQDLVNNQQKKTSLSDSPKEFLKQHLSMLADMKKSDNDFLSTIASYNSQLGSVKSCYDNLLTTYPEEVQPNDSRIVAANSFYNNKKSNNDTAGANIALELKKIDITDKLINDTISAIDNSNSSDEISALFKNYQDQIKNQELPDVTSASDGVGRQLELSGELQISTMEGGDIFNMKDTCGKISAEIERIRSLHGAGAAGGGEGGTSGDGGGTSI